MRLIDELRRLLGPHELEAERPEELAKRERFERQEERHRQALAHANQVIADVRRAERLAQEHRW
ncbi:MAG: hypothetical protein KGK07_06380 [Chloroflexota bacterium]|nr:hypothetical protein [Chloroflexota bacterium]